MSDFSEAERLLNEWKGANYLFGSGILNTVGETVRAFGETTLIVSNGSAWIKKSLENIEASLGKHNVLHGLALGSRPNTPLEDLYRISFQVALQKPASILALGSGSTIDACKAASILATYAPQETTQILGIKWTEAGKIDPYFGTGIVTKIRNATRKDIIPLVAVQTGAGSAAHLTKYSNITNPQIGQKKLIVDDAIIPKAAFFEYDVTSSAPKDLTIDGGLDGITHCWEVFMGATGKEYYRKLEHIVLTSLRLIINYLPLARKEPHDIRTRTALGLGTDLGGYAIMLGGTNGPHLASFSLVDVLTHGRACGILLPYYTVFFSPVIQDQLRAIAAIYQNAGFLKEEPTKLDGRALAEAVAAAMLRFNTALGIPLTLKDAGVTKEHIERMLVAAKDPQLRMKLLSMPLSLDPEKGDVDTCMKHVLSAAFTGDLHRVPIVQL